MRATDANGGEAAETGVEQTVAYGGGVRGSSVRVEGRRGATAGEGRACPSPVTLCLSASHTRKSDSATVYPTKASSPVRPHPLIHSGYSSNAICTKHRQAHIQRRILSNVHCIWVVRPNHLYHTACS